MDHYYQEPDRILYRAAKHVEVVTIPRRRERLEDSVKELVFQRMDYAEPAVLDRLTKAVTRIFPDVFRPLAVGHYVMNRDEQEGTAIRFQHTMDIVQHGRIVPDMLQHMRTDHHIEQTIWIRDQLVQIVFSKGSIFISALLSPIPGHFDGGRRQLESVKSTGGIKQEQKVSMAKTHVEYRQPPGRDVHVREFMFEKMPAVDVFVPQTQEPDFTVVLGVEGMVRSTHF